MTTEKRVGPYRLETRLGQGAQGEVWLARDEAEREVALKILLAKDASPKAVLAFAREATLARGLTSPHTVRVLDFGASAEGNHFIAMERLRGHDLAEMVKLFGPATPAHAVHLVKQACHSLEEAHDAGLVHRDVKPSNLFAAEVDGKHDVVKLLDFGVARSLVDLNQTAVRGTPAYLAPEVSKGGDPSVSADLYALGATIYFLLTGTPPFVGETFDVLLAHQNVEPPRPSDRVGRALPCELEDIALRCLAKKPAGRYATARDLREALEQCPGIAAWTEDEARTFWNVKREQLVRRWSDETLP